MHSVDQKIFSSTNLFNTDIWNVSWAPNRYIRMTLKIRVFEQRNAALVSIRDILQKHLKKHTNPKPLMVVHLQSGCTPSIHTVYLCISTLDKCKSIWNRKCNFMNTCGGSQLTMNNQLYYSYLCMLFAYKYVTVLLPESLGHRKRAKETLPIPKQ